MKRKPINPKNIIYGWMALWAAYLALSIVGTFVNVPSHHSSAIFSTLVPIIYKLAFIGTAPAAYILYKYRYTKKELRCNPMWLVYVCVACVVLYLLLVGSLSFTPLLFRFESLTTVTWLVGWSLALPSLIILVLGLTRPRTERDKQWKPGVLLLRSLAAVIVLSLVVGTWGAVEGLWLTADHGKFIFTNIANGCGIGALVGILALSYLQHDIYWVSGRRTAKLDERQLQERRQVFETSYKIAAALVAIAVYVLYINKHNLPRFIDDAVTFNTASGNYFWPFANVALLLIALPLVVAAYKKQRAA